MPPMSPNRTMSPHLLFHEGEAGNGMGSMLGDDDPLSHYGCLLSPKEMGMNDSRHVKRMGSPTATLGACGQEALHRSPLFGFGDLGPLPSCSASVDEFGVGPRAAASPLENASTPVDAL